MYHEEKIQLIIRACSFHFFPTGFDHIQWIFASSGFLPNAFFFYWFFAEQLRLDCYIQQFLPNSRENIQPGYQNSTGF